VTKKTENYTNIRKSVKTVEIVLIKRIRRISTAKKNIAKSGIHVIDRIEEVEIVNRKGKRFLSKAMMIDSNNKDKWFLNNKKSSSLELTSHAVDARIKLSV
jgi:hypothetical protein